MTEKSNESVKILFSFHSDLLEEWTVETMWADVVDSKKGLYKLDNIPFYAPVASEDIVFAEIDEDEQRLTYRKTVEPSGNSNIQVVLLDTNVDINSIRDEFKLMGCISEKLNDGFFVMEIPADIDYIKIRGRLSELEDDEIIIYAEPCLSRNHWYD